MLSSTVDTTVDYFGRPATFFAAYGGSTARLQELLADPRHAAHINLGVNSQGDHTLLFIALYGSANPETLTLLLEHGADPLHRDNIGRLPLHIAANTGDPKMLHRLLDYMKGKLGSDAVSTLVDDPAESTGQTPFHALCLPGTGAGVAKKLENVELTLSILCAYSSDEQASLSKPDNNGLTPLMLIKHYHANTALSDTCKGIVGPDCFEKVTIPENIGDLLKVDFFGRTPLLEAAFVGNKDVVRVELTKEDVDPNAVNIQSGRNALQVACCGLADGEMVSILLPRITDPLAQDEQGRTALHFAANTGRVDTTTALLDNETLGETVCKNINMLDINKRTPLHAVAMSSGRTKPAEGEELSTREKTIVLLFENGIDPTLRDINEHTALDLAKQFGNTVVAERIKACIAATLALEKMAITEDSEVAQPSPSFLPGYMTVQSSESTTADLSQAQEMVQPQQATRAGSMASRPQ